MYKNLKSMTTLGMPGVFSTEPSGDPFDITVADSFCIVSASTPLQLAYAVNKLATDQQWQLHGSPAHDGDRYHQWMTRPRSNAQ